jgi:hypothetical protein
MGALEQGLDGGLETIEIASEGCRCGGCGADDVAHVGAQEAVVEQGVVQRSSQPEGGEVVAVGVGIAFDDAVHPGPTQLVAHLARGQCVGRDPEKASQVLAQVAVGEPVGLDSEEQEGLEQGVSALPTEAQCRGALGLDDHRVVELGEGLLTQSGMRSCPLDVEETSVGGEADLPQGGKVAQPSADAEVTAVIDGGLCSKRGVQLVVLLDLGVLVVHVQGRGDAFGDDPGAEPTGGAAVDAAGKDQAHLVGSAYVQVVTDDLLEEDPAGHGPVEYLGKRELGLEDRDVVAVAGPAVGGGEGMGESAQPLAGEAVDAGRAERVTDPLQAGRVLTGCKAVVESLEADAGPGRLALGEMMSVDTLRAGPDYVPVRAWAGRGQSSMAVVRTVWGT